jgi:hypothetical protein
MDRHLAEMIIASSGVLGLLILAIVAMAFNYMKQMERIKRQPISSDSGVSEALDAIRKELADLRNTSTQYDVSFDTALQRIESRVLAVEQRTGRIEQEQTVGAR